MGIIDLLYYLGTGLSLMVASAMIFCAIIIYKNRHEASVKTRGVWITALFITSSSIFVVLSPLYFRNDLNFYYVFVWNFFGIGSLSIYALRLDIQDIYIYCTYVHLLSNFQIEPQTLTT